METTESSNAPLTLESAVELISVPEETEATEEVVEDVIEDEVEQPEADSTDDSEDTETAEEDEVDELDESEEDSDDEDEYEDSDDEPDQDGPEMYTVKVDGEEVQVTLDDLKRGYSGQQYVQKGMQQAAEARKQAEETYIALMRERENVAALVQQVQSGNALTPPQEPNEGMFDVDPIGYMEAKMKYDKDLKAYNEQMAQVQHVMQQQSEAELRARTHYAKEEAQKLVQIIPELADAEKAGKFKENLMKTAVDVYGYTPEEIAGISSHRDYRVLHDAMKYQEIMAGKETVAKKVKKAKPAIKPGAKQVRTKSDKSRAQRDRLMKTGSIEDALSLIMEN